MHLATALRLSLQVIRTEGLAAFFSAVNRRIFNTLRGQKNSVTSPLFRKTDIIGFYDFVLLEEAKPAGEDELHFAENTVNWLIPDFGIGSGGHLNIFRYIAMLERQGYKNTICIVGHHRHASPASAKAIINKHFFVLDAEVVFGVENLPVAQFSLATGWTTAYYLRNFSRTAHKLYFVQDFEPAFFPQGSEYDFAEETYRFGFIGICAGDWLAGLLAKNYNMRCFRLGFSFDQDLYIQTPRRQPEIRRVFCYCRPPTVRRGLETALLTLDIVGRQLPDVEFIFAGWDMGNYDFPHKHLNAGLVALKELPDLYSQCDVALVLSFTNLSLLPLEIMACGCVLVSNRGANTEWLLDDAHCMLSSASPSQLAANIIEVLENPELRANLASRAREFAMKTDWEQEGRQLFAALDEIRHLPVRA